MPSERNASPLSPSSVKELEREYWDARVAQEHSPESQRTWFEAAARPSDEWGLQAYLQPLRRLPPGTRVLEVGAGVGSKAAGLAISSGHLAVVTDLSLPAMQYGREAARAIGVPMGFCVADGESLPIRDGCCDVVLAHAALHHFPNPRTALAEMARCVRRGGHVVIGHEPNAVVFGPLRWFADRLHLTERYTRRFVSGHYSIADDLATGFCIGVLRRWVETLHLQPTTIEPVWLLTAWAFHLPILGGLLLGRRAAVPALVRRTCLAVDRLLFRLAPPLRHLALFWSLTARKRDE